MKVLIWGPKARYVGDMPSFVAELPLERIFCPRKLALETMFPQHSDADFLFVDAITPVTRDVMAQMPNLKLVHSEGVGFNSIDLTAAKERGIFVCNNKGCNAAPVAEHAIMLMLMALRHGITGHNAVRAGQQIHYKERVMAASAPELGEQAIGLIGFGDIAQATAARLVPFGCKVYYYAPHRRPVELEAQLQATYLPLEELVATCDIISLHCAVTPETTNMIDAQLISTMKPNAILVNTSRGELVDNLALREALIGGKIAGAAFDTLAPEPTPADHPLVDLPEEAQTRVVYSPHLGGISGGSFRRGHENMWNSLRLIMEGQRPNNIVNGL